MEVTFDMRLPICRLICAVVLVGLSCLIGCSGGDLGAEVSGDVTLDGQAIGPGIVSFSPADGGRNPAIGNIQSDGSYSVKTSRTEGIIPGKYKVSVTVYDSAGGGSRDAPTATKLLTPEKYSAAETSGLEFDVAPGSNTIDIPLTSQ